MTSPGIEVAVILSQDDIGLLAGRIERAYRRRHPDWHSIGLTPGAWVFAASRLCEVTTDHPTIPIDPELYVASQPSSGPRCDPWADLTQDRSLERYVESVWKIVGQLRQELRAEVRRAERRIHRGMTLDRLVSTETLRVSPLCRYILAHRAGRGDLSARLRAAAEGQHRACPLYLPASLAFLPAEAYPRPEAESACGMTRTDPVAFSLN